MYTLKLSACSVKCAFSMHVCLGLACGAYAHGRCVFIQCFSMPILYLKRNFTCCSSCFATQAHHLYGVNVFMHLLRVFMLVYVYMHTPLIVLHRL